MDATQAAAEAVTNGAEPAAKATKAGLNILSKVTNVSGNLGVGFLGVAIAGLGGGIAATSFKAAASALKG